MQWLDRLKDALGFSSPLVVRQNLPPFALGPGAVERVGQLAPGTGVHIQTMPAERGRLVVVTEGPAQGPPPFELAAWPVTVGDADLGRLRGRVLEYVDGRWAVQVSLELRAQDTPNPDGRLYLADVVLGAGRPRFFTPASPELPDLAARLLSAPGVRTVLVRENTATIERDPSVAWSTVDVGVDTALREHLLGCGEPIPAAPAERGTDALTEEVRAVLRETVLPAIHRDGGDLELVDVTDGVARVSMVGACRTCPSSTATLRLGVERTLKERFPGRVHRVEPV